ncbi:translation initiation factor 2, partial [Aspergillus nidulans FGSC A4]
SSEENDDKRPPTMQRRTIVQLSRRHPVDWPGTARLRNAAIAYNPRRCFHPALSRLNSSDSSSSSNSDDPSSPSTSQNSAPKFGSRWAPRQTSQPAALSPEEQAIRNALLTKSAAPSSSNTTTGSLGSPQPTPKFGPRWAPRQTSQPAALSPEEQAIRNALLPKTSGSSTSDSPKQDNVPASSTSVSKPGSRWAARQTSPSSTLSPDEQAIRDSLLFRTTRKKERQQDEAPSRRPPGSHRHSGSKTKAPPIDKESRDLQPLKEYEVNGASKLPKALRNQDWVCAECGFRCFGKHSICPMCKARRPGLINPSQGESRFKDWICPNCGFTCFGKHRLCPRCKARRPARNTNSGLTEPSSRDNIAGTSSPSDVKQSRGDTVAGAGINLTTDSPLEASEGSTGDSIEEPFKIRKKFAHDAEPDDGSRQSALRKHMEAKLAQAQEAGEEDLALRRRLKELRAAKRDKQEITELETDTWSPSTERRKSRGEKSRDEHNKKAKRRGGNRERESALEEEFDVDEYHRRREERKKKKKERRSKQADEQELSPLYLPEFISVSNFADVVGMRPAQLVERMEEMGFEDVSYSHVLDAETAGLIAAEFGYEPIVDTGAEQDLTAAPEPEDKSIWPSRPPVVTIMGHVDHGKTTILDWLRKSSVVASEHGGITQHIGAFSVTMPSGKKITFLDTPGHAAFLDMRRRGADVTDIVVLVVAADDSVKPQTVEAIKHATSAKVPIIVAMSKIDKEGINPERVKQDLSSHGIHVEDYGGDVQAIGVSGKTGQGMLELEEAIITLSEVLDHRADPDGFVEGWVIEASTKSYGRVATVLIRRGTLRPGDILVAGNTWARVRTLRNEAGVSISEATPGMPVEIDGWRENPTAGTELLQAEDEQHAKDVVEYRVEREETQRLGQDTAAINEARRDMIEKRRKEASEEEELTEEKLSGPKPINFVVKADVHGSAEAVENSITAIGNNEVYAKVLRSEVGPISESDIELAAAANGHIVCFNMPIDTTMSRMAQNLGVNIMDHNIIYKLVDDVKDTLSEQLAPSITKRVTGGAEVGKIFGISLKGRA